MGSIICWYFAWFDVAGGRIVTLVPLSAISSMQMLLDIPHSCGWSVCGMLGLNSWTYLFDFQSSAIPRARSPCDIFRDSEKLFMLMPVV